MSVLRALRRMILGETWTLPVGVAAVLGCGAVLRAVSGPEGWWHSAGGPAMVVLLLVLLAVSLRRGGR